MTKTRAYAHDYETYGCMCAGGRHEETCPEN